MDRDASIITGATVLAGENLEPLEETAVVVASERIAAIGPLPALNAPQAAIEVDASGLLLMPGFIDAHVHIGFADPLDVLRGGVTTARDLGWPPELVFTLAARSADASFAGPEILAAGPILTAPGGYPQRAAWAPAGTGLAVASVPEAAEAVTTVADHGAAVIKVALNPPAGPVLDRATLGAIVAAAHERGLKVTGHVTGLEELHKALETGVDELAHMLLGNEPIPRRTLEAMVAAGMAVVPTLSIRFGADRATAIENLRRFRARGGRVVYGTDLGNEGPGPGIDTLELQAMAQASMGAPDVVAAATVRAASWLSLDDRGVIAEGKLADLVTVPRAALDDPLALTRVQMVFRRGRRVR